MSEMGNSLRFDLVHNMCNLSPPLAICWSLLENNVISDNHIWFQVLHPHDIDVNNNENTIYN